jgi:hypothetical protein
MSDGVKENEVVVILAELRELGTKVSLGLPVLQEYVSLSFQFIFSVL